MRTREMAIGAAGIVAGVALGMVLRPRAAAPVAPVPVVEPGTSPLAGAPKDEMKSAGARVAPVDPWKDGTPRERLAAERIAELQRKLDDSNRRVAELEEQLKQVPDGGSAAHSPHGPDKLDDPPDWARVADGSERWQVRLPCPGPKFDASKLLRIGVPTDDKAFLETAYETARQRAWKEIEPLCRELTGGGSGGDLFGSCLKAIAYGVGGSPRRKSMFELVASIHAGRRGLPTSGDGTDTLSPHPRRALVRGPEVRGGPGRAIRATDRAATGLFDTRLRGRFLGRVRPTVRAPPACGECWLRSVVEFGRAERNTPEEAARGRAGEGSERARQMRLIEVSARVGDLGESPATRARRQRAAKTHDGRELLGRGAHQPAEALFERVHARAQCAREGLDADVAAMRRHLPLTALLVVAACSADPINPTVADLSIRDLAMVPPNHSLGVINNPMSPFVSGVKTLAATMAFRAGVTVANGGIVIAEWNTKSARSS